MKWSKRLKWLRISKIVIPIALAVTLVFAGFSVYGNEAQNFVIRTQGVPEVRLALTNDYTFNDITTVLQIPVAGASTNSTFVKERTEITDQNPKIGIHNINDIALNEDISKPFVGKTEGGEFNQFTAFSFYLCNYSERAVDYDMEMNFDGFTHNDCSTNHIEDVLRIMIIEGERSLSESSYTVYAKPEKNEENLKLLDENTDYYSLDNPAESVVGYFEGNLDNGEKLVFKRNYTDFEVGGKRKYTVLMWLEGWDAECTDDIYGERAKMSIDFFGY